MNDNIALFIFDFDGTLVEKSLHNYVGEGLWRRTNNFKKGKVFRTDKERDQAISEFTKKTTIELTQEFLANDNFGWKNKEQLVPLFKSIISSGHKIAIASFNDYPDAIKYAIEQLLGKEDAAKIYIKSGLPAYKYGEIQLCNKVPYIKEIMRNTEITNKANIFFMDDDPKNVIAAKEFEIKSVLVNKRGTEYIDSVFKSLKKFNVTCGIKVKLEYLITKPEDDPYYPLDEIGFDPIDKEYFEERKVVGEC